jgi:hypothetical protein
MSTRLRNQSGSSWANRHLECPDTNPADFCLPLKARLALGFSMIDQMMIGRLALRAVGALADASACCGGKRRGFGCSHIGRRVTTDLGAV